MLQLQSLLGLWQHVQVPWTQSPIRRHTYQVVGILSPHHTQAIHRMLQQGNVCLLLVALHYWYNKQMLTWRFWSSRMWCCVLFQSTLKMKALTFFNMWTATHLIRQRPIQEDCNLHDHQCENVKTHILWHVTLTKASNARLGSIMSTWLR
jgi:hypothetical protein